MGEEKKPTGEMYSTAIVLERKKQEFLTALYEFECACRRVGYVEQGNRASHVYSKVCEMNIVQMVESF